MIDFELNDDILILFHRENDFHPPARFSEPGGRMIFIHQPAFQSLVGE
jgi:hypothetical protein